MSNIVTLPTPSLLVNRARLEANVARMQARCDALGVALWPHIKTHKTVEIARMQLDAGATGLTCAKLGEAEAMLPSGVRRVFLAYPLADPVTQAPRLRALADALDELIVAVTSEAQREALSRILAAADLRLPVLMAVDTGLGREGVRGVEEARRLARAVRSDPRMRLKGLFTHEGYAYREGVRPAEVARESHAVLVAVRDAILSEGYAEEEAGFWPGSSVTAAESTALPGVRAVRPGAYVLGDLWLSRITDHMAYDEVALSVLATVVDRPQLDLVLVDAGSKTLSSDKVPPGLFASAANGRNLDLTRLSEEHGFVTGADVDRLRVGDRLTLIPAHVCPVVNLADELVICGPSGEVIDTWRVAARGKVR